MATPTFDHDLFRDVVAKEYTAMEDADIDKFSQAALNEISEEFFGDLFARAWCNLTAHLIFLSDKESQESGVLDKYKAGNIEKQFMNQSRNSFDYSYEISSYGREYIRLRSLCPTTPVFLGGVL